MKTAADSLKVESAAVFTFRPGMMSQRGVYPSQVCLFAQSPLGGGSYICNNSDFVVIAILQDGLDLILKNGLGLYYAVREKFVDGHVESICKVDDCRKTKLRGTSLNIA